MIDIQKILQSLSSIDISKIDAASALTVVSKRRDILISTILILATFFAVRYIVVSANEKKNSSQTELTQLEEKQKTALALEAKQKEFATFQQNTPNGFQTETEVIKAVVGLAESYGVKVLFYNPKDATEEESYTIQTVDFVFESSFEAMLQTLRAIEKSKINLQINSWKNSAATAYRYDMRGVAKKTDGDVLQWEASISSIKVKE